MVARRDALIAATIVVLTFSFTSGLKPTSFNNFVWLADAWLHGHLYLPHFPGAYIDAMPYHGRAWVVEAPTPAILLVPFVAIWGLQTNQTMLGIALAGLATYGVWRTAEYLGLDFRARLLCAAFLAFGTSLGYCATDGGVWFTAHLGAVSFTSLALAELYGEGRPWLIAIWASLAAFSRYPLLLALPGYAALLYARSRRFNLLTGYVAALVPVAIASIIFNYARWGTLQDIGFPLWYKMMDIRARSGLAAFDIHYLPMQLTAYFITGPTLSSTFPWVRPDKFGLALTWMSPALIVAFFARRPRWDVAIYWILAIVTAGPALLYYDLGGVQLGMRHALDFIPFLLVLMMLALREGRAHRLFIWLASYSIVFSLYELIVLTRFSASVSPHR